MKPAWRLINADTGQTVCQQMSVADTLLTRTLGLQFRSRLWPGCGLLIVPASTIHTFWMLFDLDLVMMDEFARVSLVHHAVRPWKVVLAPPETYAVLELPAHTANVRRGDRLSLAMLDNRCPLPPRSLDFLMPETAED